MTLAVEHRHIIFKRSKAENAAFRQLRRVISEGYNIVLPKVNEWMNKVKVAASKGFDKFAKDEAVDIVTELTDWEFIEKSGHMIVKPALIEVMDKSGKQAMRLAGVEAAFDVLNENAVRLANTITSHMITEVTEETKKAITWFIRDGLEQGKGIPGIAREIRPKIGLTERQMRASANFEEKLLANRPELSQKQIRRRVATYDKKQLKLRHETIARTETQNAVAEGTLEGYRQSGILDEVIWLADGQCCDVCDGNNGQRFVLNEASGIPAHPRCECCWIPAF